jgi:hypothetical protein
MRGYRKRTPLQPTQTFKRNPRKLALNSLAPVQARLQYINNYCYSGDRYAFARAIGVASDVLKRALLFRPQLSLRLLVQILTTTTIRAEWLLYGAGPMFSGRRGVPKIIPGALSLPALFQTRYPLFDTLTVGVPPAFTSLPATTVESSSGSALTADHIAAAQAIYSARVADKPVVCFLGAPALSAGAGILAGEMLARQYVTGVATTGQGLVCDIYAANVVSPPDLNYVARLAASQGLGYGEAVGRWGFPHRDIKRRSIMHAAYTLGIPATAHVELGEIDQHAAATARGAELGAAVGAASYTDFLIFTEQVRRLLEDIGGVFIVAGEVERGLNLFFRAYAAVKATGATLAPFTVILMGNTAQLCFQEQVRSHGGHYHSLQGNYRANVCHLLEACTAVYSGKVPHDLKQRLSIESRTEVD